MKIILLTICLSCVSLVAHGQERVLKVTLEGLIPYDTLKCSTVSEYFDKIYYLGKCQTSTNSWLFHIPDTVFEESRYIRFFANRKNTPEIKYIRPSFRIITERDTTSFWSELSFFEKTDTLSVYAQFVRQDTIRNSIYYGTYGTDQIVITPKFDLKNPSLELQRAIVNTNNHYAKYKGAPSNQFYDIFCRMISQAPSSHSSMLLLYGERNTFSLEQLLSLRNMFVEEQKQSHYGRKLDEYIKLLMDKFPDTELTNCLTKQKETIVVNENKYTLLVFSASWCAPCHKLIPLLKELYEKKKEVMDIVYVTLDEPDRLSEWNQLVKKQEISWRTLTVDGKINEIRDRYKVFSIPYSYLIYPGKKKADRLEIRKDEDKLKIENLNLAE
ncbi:thioredoxin family protein [Bacteroides sp. GM023]|uniref:TlpA family protein disulfide reductase n=1 Tax=Bacteroides sp. GM023 TaxID=2723058 RepID=UPI00168B8576|nr:thioredoxin family protein [Bacteroides sp. GM023]MBD3588366.1 redoxin domain-containing protein [Bacteroides sp. GM023]